MFTGAEHLREIFYRMGLSDKDIVALSGAHTLVNSWPSPILREILFNSLVLSYVNLALWIHIFWFWSLFWYIKGKAHRDRSGFEGSWTKDPLKFDNSYFV